MGLDEKGFPQPTGEFEKLEADSLVLALGQDVDLSLLDGVPGLRGRRTASCRSTATMMTGYPGLFAGGDMVPAERTVTVGGRPRQEGRAPHRRLAARRDVAAPRRSTRRRPSSSLNTWYYSDAPKTVRPQLDLARRTSSFDEVQGA